MSEPIAEALVLIAAAYLALGGLFAIAFVVRGVQRIDPAARGGGGGFRLAVLPASIALWPLLAHRWWRATRSGAPTGPPVERNAHRQAAQGTTVETTRSRP